MQTPLHIGVKGHAQRTVSLLWGNSAFNICADQRCILRVCVNERMFEVTHLIISIYNLLYLCERGN